LGDAKDALRSLGEAGPPDALRYLIESTSTPPVKYTGYTDNLKQRLDDHNSGKKR
jgi:hypothetical protein